MLGVQSLGVLCLATWGIISTCIVLWVSLHRYAKIGKERGNSSEKRVKEWREN
jgi:hypothetical protein